MFRRTIIIASLASLVFALAGTAALAQGLRGRGVARGGRAGRGLERLQQNLGLSDSQRNGVQALVENRRKEMASLQQELQQKRQALGQLLRQSNPNANDVGNAALALKEVRGRRREINQRLESGIKGLLTPDQLQKLPKRLRQR